MEHFKRGSKLLYDFMPYSFADFVFGLHYSYKNPQNFNVLEQLFFDRYVIYEDIDITDFSLLED